MEPVKILLTSDLHLGMERLNPLISRDERFTTLKSILSLAEKHDILLLAGDIFNDQYIDNEYFAAINKQFEKTVDSGTEIYFTPGLSEIEKSGSFPERLLFLKTTFTFSDPAKESVFKSDKGNIFIYGAEGVLSENRPASARGEKAGFHIGLFHTDFSPQLSGKSARGCIGKDEIRKMNLDFYALGKNHGFRMFRFSDRILGAYPGSPEPCSIDECGDRFVISMEVEDNRLSSLKRIQVNTVTVHSREIDCSYIHRERDLTDIIKNISGRECMNRIELCGERDFSAGDMLARELTGFFRGLKITDRTTPSMMILIEELGRDNSLKGFYFRNLLQRLKKNPDIKLSSNLVYELFADSDRETGRVLFCDSQA